VSSILLALLGTLLATNEPSVGGNQAARAAVAVPDSNDPVEKEYQKLLAEDDASQEEVDQWIRENREFEAKGAGISDKDLNRRIRARFDPVKKGYEDFLKAHPGHARAHVAYGTFLGDLNDEDGAQAQLEKALDLNARDPAVYNNLANIYGHTGPVKKAFEYYAKAIELNPRESVYYHNFGTTVFLFRKDAMEYYNITEQKVFDKALELYAKAMANDPKNFDLASDVAQTYYGIKPSRTEEALKAWTNALSLATDDTERQGVQIHFARIKLHVGRLAEARDHLNSVSVDQYAELKTRLTRNLAEEESKAAGTNAPAEAGK
jgi:tetratricopeptide (TPR) repeat protein